MIQSIIGILIDVYPEEKISEKNLETKKINFVKNIHKVLINIDERILAKTDLVKFFFSLITDSSNNKTLYIIYIRIIYSFSLSSFCVLGSGKIKVKYIN